ncbi:MAG TPA: Ppx/GppA family phosphatase [Deltaproteobacteria bacterium]|nr:Ppx/GppA family phosphatase [Deltaproteobacteria bacterium]
MRAARESGARAPRRASIDIGTNTLRLLVAEVEGRSLTPLVYERRITRLGGGYSEKRGISPEAARRTLRALEEFAALLGREGVDEVRAVATSVVRRAVNGRAFLDEVRERTGIDAEVIDGGEEARLSLIGVLSVVERRGPLLAVDIGGGSTEFIAAAEGGGVSSWSMEMGVVHLAERYLASDPPAAAELSAMEAGIARVLGALKGRMKEDGVEPGAYGPSAGARLVGTAGTVTTLAALDLGLERYDRERINNHVLRKAVLRRLYRRLSAMTAARRCRLPGLEKGREDLIIPGAAIALETMGAFGQEEMIVSDAGLLEGVILDGAGAPRAL